MNEADIPIDIHTGKLQEWLVSRRIVPKTTQDRIRDIRNKIGNAVKDMPANEDLIKLLSGTHINYFHCKQIIEILKQTEKDTKSVFGTYGSQRMKDWQEIVKLYEKDSIYLAEAAQILVRNINYELPGLKKQMSRFEQQSDEALKRIQDLNKSENILLNEHSALCQQLGIKGENIASELVAKLNDLPEIYAESIKNLGILKGSIDYYNEFIETLDCLPIIKFLIANGNSTVYQYLYHEAPVKIEEPTLNLNLKNMDNEKSSSTDNEIDFGLDSNGAQSDSNDIEAIDFGDLNTEDVTLESGDIDWGETEDTTSTQEIDFDVSLDDYGIVVEGVGMDGGIAKGEEAYTLLDSPKYRDQFIDELYELESFLKLRLYELTSIEKSSSLTFAFMNTLSAHDSGSVEKMLANIDSIISKVMNEQTQHLHQLKHSPKYASILASKLQQKLNAVEKIKATKEVLKSRSSELNSQKISLKPVFDKMVQHTRVLQGQIEQDISRRYKNRIVNLMGGVNSI